MIVFGYRSRHGRVVAAIRAGLAFLLVQSLLAAEPTDTLRAPQWSEVELTFTRSSPAANAYTDVEAWVEFVHDDGTVLRRPMFWDGGRVFRVRFASTKDRGT